MFKSIAILALSLSIVGCAVTPPQTIATPNRDNFNIAKDAAVVSSGKPLHFVAFEKKTSSIVTENGKRFKNSLFDFGSGAQWNSDYVVTAKHVDFIKDSVYVSKSKIDIQFVKRHSDVFIPVWRNARPLENLTFVGINQEAKKVAFSGKDTGKYAATTVNEMVYLVDTEIQGGMSGGPVYSDDGAIVGIGTGVLSGEALGFDKNKLYSAYIPLSVIQKEWEKFQNQ